MTPHGHTTIKNPTGEWSPALPMDRSRRFVLVVTLLAGLFMTTAGVAALAAPSWFADTAGFPRHTHFVHDAGAFQLGIGITLLLALIWHDGLALALAGFLVANTTHAINHAVDLDQGPPAWRPGHWRAAGASLLGGATTPDGGTRRIGRSPSGWPQANRSGSRSPARPAGAGSCGLAAQPLPGRPGRGQT